MDPRIGSSGQWTGSAGAGARPRFDKVPSEVPVLGPELPLGGTEETFSAGSAGKWTGTADWKRSTDFPVRTSSAWTGSSDREKELQAGSSQSELPVYIPELPTEDDQSTRNLAEI